jgi:hypothetical protein
LGASPLAGAEFSYARGVISCSGVDLGLQAEYVVCKAGEWFKAWVLFSFSMSCSQKRPESQQICYTENYEILQ